MQYSSRLFLLPLLVGVMLCSCVSSRKYEDLRQQTDQTRLQRDSLSRALDANRLVDFKLQRKEADLEVQKESNERLKEQFDALNDNYQRLLRRYDDIIFQNQSLLSSASDEKQKLVDALAKSQLELDAKEREVKRLEYAVEQHDQELEELGDASTAITNCEAQLNKLTNLLQQRDAALQQLRGRINQALLGFSSEELSVSEANGRIYVTLSQNLLFKSNSDQVDWKGKKALKTLAEVLQRNTDTNVNVEGHTDSDGSTAKNWDLSVRRATSVVKLLTGYGLDPKRVTASGRSFYSPVASNASAAGKASNRRTEIILTPNLDDLYEIINP